MSRIAIISNSDSSGGAARAAYRLHRNLLASNVEVKMLVQQKKSDDWTVHGPMTLPAKLQSLIRPRIGARLLGLQKTGNVNTHSMNILPSNWAGRLNDSNIDIVNLHWVGGEMISIEDIGKIRKPIVWTLHDMWSFCGSEHIADEAETARWKTGYSAHNKPSDSSGLDIDRYCWNRKRRAWKNHMHIVTPSSWLAKCVQQSVLMKDWPVSVIPNVLDLDTFKPLDKIYSRYILNLPADKKILLFGALGGAKDPLKGFDLLLEALNSFAANHKTNNILCVMVGQSEPRQSPELPFPGRWMGHIHDDATLALIYSAADVIIIPSRQENLPQSGTEAHACGCPAVAFHCSGLPEVIEHLVTGYLAKPYQTDDLANGIAWILADDTRRANLGLAARKKAENVWSARTVLPAYTDAYEAAKICTNNVSLGKFQY